MACGREKIKIMDRVRKHRPPAGASVGECFSLAVHHSEDQTESGKPHTACRKGLSSVYLIQRATGVCQRIAVAGLAVQSSAPRRPASTLGLFRKFLSTAVRRKLTLVGINLASPTATLVGYRCVPGAVTPTIATHWPVPAASTKGAVHLSCSVHFKPV